MTELVWIKFHLISPSTLKSRRQPTGGNSEVVGPAVFPDHSHGMEAHRRLRMPVEERHLFAQLQRIDPVVVSLAQCEVLAASSRQGAG